MKAVKEVGDAGDEGGGRRLKPEADQEGEDWRLVQGEIRRRVEAFLFLSQHCFLNDSVRATWTE